jgi:predicted nucleic acid-binding protein
MSSRTPRSIAERRVWIDSSGFVALVNRRDRYYQRASDAVDALALGRYRLFTTEFFVVEAHASIIRSVGAGVARQFLRTGLDGITVVPTVEDDLVQARDIVFRHADKDYSYCDAISFSMMRRGNVQLAFAFDDHFRQFGFSTPIERADWP